ncbi:MAG: hypothetical protein CMJ89_17490 [Planctomycetes bacterium]|jgi:cytochrome c peroxidase|nr:hypothetical protein [Planctomycetota bacterium]
MFIHKHTHWLITAVLLVSASVGHAQGREFDLSTLPAPRPNNLSEFIKDETAAILLGKALFWDEQVGSDGRTACATCHFQAGADVRVVNTMNPGTDGFFQSVQAGRLIRPRSFPMTNDDIAGSQGVVDHDFTGIVPGNAVDAGEPTLNAVYGPHPQVTGRNAPSVINAVYNVQNFWDGRASGTFNGVNPGGFNGDGTSAGNPLLCVQADTSVKKVLVSADSSSAASQAVGPPNSDVEMAWAGRSFPDIGKKMLSLRPLASQRVSPGDSVLGSHTHASGLGLDLGYGRLVRMAFDGRWWNSRAIVDAAGDVIGTGIPVGPDQYSVMEYNFSLFWGFAIQMYESTLVSDDSPVDRFARGDADALTAQEQFGFEVFQGRGQCDLCHATAVFTDASNGSNGSFEHTGVRPIEEDAGRGNGEFKTPTTRNTELNGPYFHNGGYATLRQVVDFYDRGGDFPNDELRVLNLTEEEKDALVAFMMAQTDERVRFSRAPFDHPSLRPVNHLGLSAVGAGGTRRPLPTFLRLSPFSPGIGVASLEPSSGATSQLSSDTTTALRLLSSSSFGGERFTLFLTGRRPAGLRDLVEATANDSMAGLDSAPLEGAFTVQGGLLDSSGTASVELLAPAGASSGETVFARFVVSGAASNDVLAISNILELQAAH